MIKNRLIYTLLLFLADIMLPFHIAESQSHDSLQPEKMLEEYCKVNPWEEVFVHTDRSDYIAGEDIWMKVYNFDRASGVLSGRSIIVYIELLNPWNNPVIQIRLPLNGGTGSGNIFLPDSLSSGTYTLRAYTNIMKNYLPGNCFMYDINVYNPFRNNGFMRKVNFPGRTEAQPGMKFYPEGGTLVYGLNCRVVVRYTDEYGRGIRGNAFLKDNEGNEKTSFPVDDNGYGFFIFNPEKGKTYTVIANDRSYNLPQAADEGVTVMAKVQDDKSVLLTISASQPLSFPSAGKYHIIVHSKGKTFYKTDITSPGTAATLNIPASSAMKGIIQISVFGGGSLPLAERLIFIPDDDTKINSVSLKGDYGRREKVTVGVALPGQQDAKADFSVSVVPASLFSEREAINDNLVFGSEFGIPPWRNKMRGSQNFDQVLADNFLVTAHSNWIKWNEILQNKPPVRQYRVENEGHFISGILKNRETGIPDTSALLYLSVAGKPAMFRYAVTDSEGRFSFLLPADNIRRRVIIQPADTVNNSVLEMESPFSRRLPESFCFSDTLSAREYDMASQLSFNYQAARIYLTKYKTEPPPEATGVQKGARFYGIPETVIRLDDYIRLPVMQEVFFELVPGVRFRERRSGYEMRVLNPVDNLFYDEPPLTLIDGVVVRDLSLVANLDPENVEKIEVVRSRYKIGNLVLNGIVNIVTFSGSYGAMNLPDYAVEMSYRTIEKSGFVFLPPEYSDSAKRASRIPDMRNTIYWSHSVRPDKNGRLNVIFWTHDIPGDYIIDIQGVTGSGRTFSYSTPFRIRQDDLR